MIIAKKSEPINHRFDEFLADSSETENLFKNLNSKNITFSVKYECILIPSILKVI